MSAVAPRPKTATPGPHAIYLTALLNGCLAREDGSQWLRRSAATPVERRPPFFVSREPVRTKPRK